MLKQKEKIKNKRKSQLIIFGSFLIIIGNIMIISKFLYNYFQIQTEKDLIDKFYDEEKIKKKIVEEESTSNNEQNKNVTTDNEYIGILKITKYILFGFKL